MVSPKTRERTSFSGSIFALLCFALILLLPCLTLTDHLC